MNSTGLPALPRVSGARGLPGRQWATLLPVLVAIAMALLWRPSASVGDTPVPMGFDSFYHATRVLHALEHDQWLPFDTDPRLLAPEGTTVPWSWGWDAGLTGIARVGLALSPGSDPVGIISGFPPLLAGMAVLLMARILSLLGLGWGPQQVGCWALALHPMTQGLFGWGVLDHHGGEFLGWLAVLWATLALWRQPGAFRWGLLGFCLGAVLLVHTSMFVVQIPLLAALICLPQSELQRLLSPRAARAFALALLAATLAVVLPAPSFARGQVDFGHLGGFHLLIAAATASVVVALGYRRETWFRVVLVLLPAAGLLLVTGPNLFDGMRFVSGTMSALDSVGEGQPLWRFAAERGWYGTIRFYSPWLLVLPLAVFLGARDALAGRQTWFWPWIVALGFGCAFMANQFRFHYFGLPFLPWAAAKLADWMHARGLARAAWIALPLALAINLNQLLVRQPTAMDAHYARFAALFPMIAEACHKEPRLIVAHPKWGHFLRYHTQCPVYASQFVASRGQEARWLAGARLFASSETQLMQTLPTPYYLLVSLAEYGPDSAATVGQLLGPRNALQGRVVLEASGKDPAGASVLAMRLIAYPGPAEPAPSIP